MERATSRRRRVLDRVGSHPLAAEVTSRRLQRMVDVAVARLSSITVVLENLWDPHNVSAVVRTAEGLGLSSVHLVEEPHPARLNRNVTHGAQRWLEIHRYPAPRSCLSSLGRLGFTTCAADVGDGVESLSKLPRDRPLALIFGSEKHGLTTAAKEVADRRFTIPMPGMTQSFNVSVSAAVALHSVVSTRRERLGEAAGDLGTEEASELVVRWLQERASRRG